MDRLVERSMVGERGQVERRPGVAEQTGRVVPSRTEQRVAELVEPRVCVADRAGLGVSPGVGDPAGDQGGGAAGPGE